MISGFKYAEISDGTKTITIPKLLSSSFYNKKQLAKKDVDNKLNVIEEIANIQLVSTDLSNKETLRSWGLVGRLQNYIIKYNSCKGWK